MSFRVILTANKDVKEFEKTPSKAHIQKEVVKRKGFSVSNSKCFHQAWLEDITSQKEKRVYCQMCQLLFVQACENTQRLWQYISANQTEHTN